MQDPMNALKNVTETIYCNPNNSAVTMVQLSQAEHNRLFTKRQTPTILLLCKEITAEAASLLYDIPLRLDFKPRNGHWEIMDFMSSSPYEERRNNNQPVFKWCMISCLTLKQVRIASFEVSSWFAGNPSTGTIQQPWFYILAMCGIWKQEDSKLKELHIRVNHDKGFIGAKAWVIPGSQKEIVSDMPMMPVICLLCLQLKIMWKQQLLNGIHNRIVDFLDRQAKQGRITAFHTPR